MIKILGHLWFAFLLFLSMLGYGLLLVGVTIGLYILITLEFIFVDIPIGTWQFIKHIARRCTRHKD